MKFSQVVAGFWLDKRITFSPRTEPKYKVAFARFIELVGDKEVESISTGDIRAYLVGLRTQHEDGKRRKLTQRTLFSYWAVHSSLWTWIEKELQIPNVLRGKVQAPDWNETPIDPYTEDDIKRLLAAAKWLNIWVRKKNRFVRGKRPTADRDAAIIMVLIDTGIRASELCDLRIADYDPKRGRLHIKHGKGDKARYVLAGNRAQKALWKYLTNRPKAKQIDFLFETKTGNRIDHNNLRRTMQEIAKRAEVKNVFIHRFRHTFAIQFLRNGGGIRQLQELMGHESIEQTMRYVNFVESDIEGSEKFLPADNWRL